MADVQGMVAVIVYPDGCLAQSDSEFGGSFCNQQDRKISAVNKVKRKFWARATATSQWFRDVEPTDHYIDLFWEIAEKAGYRLFTIPIKHGDEHE